MAQKGWLVHLERCTGCHGCTIACKTGRFKDSERAGMLRRFAVGVPQPVTADYFVPMSCNHCEKPSCLAACPKGALYKDAATGIVLQDLDRCVGCRRCEWACPYGAIEFNSENGKVTKCDMCYERQSAGEQPWCVATCAGFALNVVESFDINESGAGAPAVFADKALTKPAIKFTGPVPPVVP